ncbi:PH domain-containing protein [Clostridium hydrogeniformans]|uniref:PH domain-containing protein n=1 Tax=Clostridium hydrogeniformans TaxID=349933 RepID=UPI00047F1C48|nr:PH domain-containing protein [Clostridium hydrogeniformans]
MEIYKPPVGLGLFFIIITIVAVNVIVAFIGSFINSYVVITLLKLFMVVATGYCIYYLFMLISLKYIIRENEIEIDSFFSLRKEVIKFKDILGYSYHKGAIRGIKLSGIGNNFFGIGRSIIDKVGLTYLYVTSAKNVIYIKTEDMSFGISPENVEAFKELLISKNIKEKEFQVKKQKSNDLFKEKRFFIPFIIATVIIIFVTLNPFILYLNKDLPITMPLNFNESFVAIEYGTSKQFVFRQMTYGVLNMVILVCMYYGAHFSSKYDRKSAYKYMYISIIMALAFAIIQLRILSVFI